MPTEPRSTKPYPWKCGRCRQRAVNPATIDYATMVEHDGRSYEVHVAQLPVARCEACGEVVLDDDANQRLSDAVRSQLGVLTPAQITQYRGRLGLTQAQLATALGVSEATMSRWEAGLQIQSRALDRLLRLYFGCEQVRTVLADEAQLASLISTS